MHSVLFICSANVCRSPMAMGLLQAYVGQEIGEWRIESAGVWSLEGYSAAQNAQIVVKTYGVDLSMHRSRLISADMVKDFNLILTMERGHKEALRAAFPQFAGRIFMLSEMVGEVHDVVDPMGRALADFEETAQEINKVFKLGEARIQNLSGDP